MATFTVTGAASGIGAATATALLAAGHRVIGLDIRNADIVADLSSPTGRQDALAAILSTCSGVLDGLVLCAGLGPQTHPVTLVPAVNYFGAVELLDGLLPALSKGKNPAAVVVSSVASSQLPWDSNPLASALEAGNHDGIAAILEQAGDAGGNLAYAGSKNALTVAVRKRVLEWGKAQVRLNTLAPGAVETPLLQAGLDDPRYAQSIRDFVSPLGRNAKPEEMAATICFLLSEQAGFIHGAQFFVDGGIDAMMRPTLF